jgi:hypothetical protein
MTDSLGPFLVTSEPELAPWGDGYLSNDPERSIRFRNYAEELRIIAQEASADSRNCLERIAGDYERMARSLEGIETSRQATMPCLDVANSRRELRH